jgi:hypothetical protein
VKCRVNQLGCPNVMEDVEGVFQETGQEKRPARMVGLLSLDSAKLSKDAGWDSRDLFHLRREGVCQ